MQFHTREINALLQIVSLSFAWSSPWEVCLPFSLCFFRIFYPFLFRPPLWHNLLCSLSLYASANGFLVIVRYTRVPWADARKGRAPDNEEREDFCVQGSVARCIRLFPPINPSGLDDGHATIANDRGVYDARHRFRPSRSTALFSACGMSSPRVSCFAALHTRFSSDANRSTR